MRAISLERIGEYLKTAIQIIHENGNEYPVRLLIIEMQKRLKPSEYEMSKGKTGGVRWIVKFKWRTVGFVKANLIKKQKKTWYLTNEGLKLVDKAPLDLINITRTGYEEWNKQRNVDEKGAKVPVSIKEALRGISPTSPPPASSMTIKPMPITFNELLKGVDKSIIQIPPFQRDFVWSAKAIADLLDSIYRGYPIGSFIFWKTHKRLPRHREIGGIKLNDIPAGNLIDYIIDGQQRITSLYAAIKGARIEENRYRFYFDISTGKFNYDRIEEGEETTEAASNDYTLVPLEKIFVDSTSYFRYIEQFPEKHREILHDLYNRFKEYSFSVIYVQNEDEDRNIENNREDIEKIVRIFSRINDTGRKLTVVAKMVALCWEKNFDLREKLNALLTESEELSQLKEETVLQIASVVLNNKKCRTRNILGDTNIAELEQEWNNIIKAFRVSLDFFRNKLRIKNFKYLPFDSLLVPLTYFHYTNHNPSNNQAEQLFRWFWKACLSNRFGSTVESKIEEDCSSFDKILNNETVDFNYPIDWDTFKLQLINQNYNFRNAFCKTVLSLYSYMRPRGLKDNRDIDLVKGFSAYSKHNLHHFFPRAYLDRVDHPKKELRDSIVNIAFTPSILNIEMRNRAPSEYLREFSKSNQDSLVTLQTHLISDPKEFGLLDNNFDLFLKKRVEKIENEFRSLLGLKTKTEKQFEEEPATPIDLLEARMRALLNSCLIDGYGEDYWKDAIPQDIRINVDKKVEDDIKIHPYNKAKYISCEARLVFLEIMDYYKVIMSNWVLFKDMFLSKPETEKHFIALKNYRNPIKHGRPLDPVAQKSGEAAVLWFDQVLTTTANK